MRGLCIRGLGSKGYICKLSIISFREMLADGLMIDVFMRYNNYTH
jgi:hypothetical protein